MADIEKTFYQVCVPTEDAKYLCFLWWPGGDVEKAPEEFQMLVHFFGGVPSPSCASYSHSFLCRRIPECMAYITLFVEC